MTNDEVQFDRPWTITTDEQGHQVIAVMCLDGTRALVQVPSNLVILPDSTVTVKQRADSKEIRVFAIAARAADPEGGNTVSWVAFLSAGSHRTV
jgi:hypothetical protein